MEQNIKIVSRIIQSPIGFLEASANASGICKLCFIDEEAASQEHDSHQESGIHLDLLELELGEYFAGKRRAFTVQLTPVGTDFQQLVWQKLLQIPYGETRTYKQQTNLLGNPEAIRAVASANSRNPIAIIIPCHRVIGSNGSLTGYAGGLPRKKWLLDHERLYSGQPVQGSLFD